MDALCVAKDFRKHQFETKRECYKKDTFFKMMDFSSKDKDIKSFGITAKTIFFRGHFNHCRLGKITKVKCLFVFSFGLD